MDGGDQVAFRCALLRGGTSRGLFFHDHDLPPERAVRERIFLAALGSPDPRQINGVGGGDSHTSKVMAIARSTRPGVDVDYTFAQVLVAEPRVDWRANCGNLSAAVGAFAVDEGLVAPVEPVTPVVAYNTNTRKVIYVDVPVRGGRAAVTGDTAIAGVAGTGAPILVDFRDAAGTATGSLLPTGRAREAVEINGTRIEVSIVDAANPGVFIKAEDVGLRGTELPGEISADPALLGRLQVVRAHAAARLGFVDSSESGGCLDWRDAFAKTPSVPIMILVAPPADYAASDGRPIRADQIDLVGRPIAGTGLAHKSFPGTGSVCAAAAALIPGTVVHEVARPRRPGRVVLGHGLGTLELAAAVEPEGDGYRLTRAALVRTARRLMDGVVYVPRSALPGASV